MKKLVVLLLSISMCLFTFSACSKDGKDYIFYVPDGAPVLAIAQLWDENAVIGDKKVGFELVKGGDPLNGAITNKVPDIALAPINVCAMSVAMTNGEYVLAGTAVNGLMYIVAQNGRKVDSLNDLIGETLYAFQENATPGITLKIVLERNEVPFKVLTATDTNVESDKVNLKFLSSPLMVRDALTVGLEGEKISYGLLAEPVVTAITSGAGVQRVLDLQELWGEGGYPQVGVIVRKSIAENDPEFVADLLKKLDESSKWARENAADAAAKAVNEVMSTELPAAAGIRAFLEGSGQNAYSFKPSSQCKDTVKDFLSEIAKFNNNLVGGEIPDDSFYLS